jgi:hypothetical protein
VVDGEPVTTTPADIRHDLALFQATIRPMQAPTP